MTRAAVLPGLSVADHRPHLLHAAGQFWPEKNCYTDLWIELLSALGLEPHACLAFVLGVDFEGDQWTFFKPALTDLRDLYGIDVQELTVWRPVLDHAVEHLGAGRWLAVEVDAFWLPDTSATDYRQNHAKTTIVFNEVDTVERRLGYFHNAGYYALAGEDFEGLFAPSALPPYAELIRSDRLRRLDAEELRARSRQLLDRQLGWCPQVNPVLRFGERCRRDVPTLQAAGPAYYHRWAFAGIRQFGAASELTARYLQWLCGADAPIGAVDAFVRIAERGKALLMKTARIAHSSRTADVGALLDAMALDWELAMSAVQTLRRR